MHGQHSTIGNFNLPIEQSRLRPAQVELSIINTSVICMCSCWAPQPRQALSRHLHNWLSFAAAYAVCVSQHSLCTFRHCSSAGAWGAGELTGLPMDGGWGPRGGRRPPGWDGRPAPLGWDREAPPLNPMLAGPARPMSPFSAGPRGLREGLIPDRDSQREWDRCAIRPCGWSRATLLVGCS